MGDRAQMDNAIFSGPKQLGFDLGETSPGVIEINPDDIRQELLGILELARSSQNSAPWDVRTHRYHQTVFPQMVNWLPEAERADLVTQFRAELARIENLLAA